MLRTNLDDPKSIDTLTLSEIVAQRLHLYGFGLALKASLPPIERDSEQVFEQLSF